MKKTDFTLKILFAFIKLMNKKKEADDTRKFVKKNDDFNPNHKLFKTGESPSTNGQSNAKSMALIASVLS